MILPDLLDYNLNIVFCGMAASKKSKKFNAYYAGPGNKFWKTLYNIGLTSRQLKTEEFKQLIKKGAFITCGWDGNSETELKIKKDTNATIRCIPIKQNTKNLNCIYSSKKAKYQVIFAKAY